MFPVQLVIYLAVVKSREEIESLVRSWFPALNWGDSWDLMKHSDDWPEAVVSVETDTGEEGDAGFPVKVDFLVFPRRVRGRDAVMYPAKIALMRRFAHEFECRTLCDAQGYSRDAEDYTRRESFLCQAGRFYSGNVGLLDFREYGRKPHGGWQPLDDVPCAALDARGRLIDEEATVAAHTRWREGRLAPEPPLEFADEDGSRDDEFETDEDKDDGDDSDSDEDFFGSVFDSPDIEESGTESEPGVPRGWEDLPYLKRMSEWENGFGTTSSKELIKRGVALPAPESMDDEALHDKLWEVIRALGEQNTFLHSTNHLSDRELYAYLWKRGLNEQTMDLTGLTGCACHLDILGSGSEESTFLHFKYYDGPQSRADWMASWPDYEMPAHENPPFDRDRQLPQSPW